MWAGMRRRTGACDAKSWKSGAQPTATKGRCVAEVDDDNIMVSSGGYRRLVGRDQADEGSPHRKRDQNPAHHHANTHAYILLERFL